MVDNTSTHVRKVGGKDRKNCVRFTVDKRDSSNEDEENPFKIAEFQWEQCCNNQCSFDLYFGILKLCHSYTMTMDVTFQQNPIQLETIIDDQNTDRLQLLVTQFPTSHLENRTSFQVELLINLKSIPGHFHRTFLLKETSTSQQRSVTVNVTGKILRQDQGTATLRYGVHMKSIIKEEDDE